MTPNTTVHLFDREQNLHQRDRIHRMYQDGQLDGPAYLRRLRETPLADEHAPEVGWTLAAVGVLFVFAAVGLALSR